MNASVKMNSMTSHSMDIDPEDSVFTVKYIF
jgi:hypothetical protein